MKFMPNGKMIFDDIYEMYYNLFLELGLAVNNDGYLYDTESNIVLKFKDKYIKAAMTRTPVYPGAFDIVFDPSQNYMLMVYMMGYYIDKESSNGEDRIGFIAQYIDEDRSTDDKIQRVVVKTRNGNIYSQYYHNIFLAYIEMVFILSGNTSLDLSNFDIVI